LDRAEHARKNNNDSASSDEETDSDEKLDGVQEEEDPKAWVYNGRTDAEERIGMVVRFACGSLSNGHAVAS